MSEQLDSRTIDLLVSVTSGEAGEDVPNSSRKGSRREWLTERLTERGAHKLL
jgi:hypothetical protein